MASVSKHRSHCFSTESFLTTGTRIEGSIFGTIGVTDMGKCESIEFQNTGEKSKATVVEDTKGNFTVTYDYP